MTIAKRLVTWIGMICLWWPLFQVHPAGADETIKIIRDEAVMSFPDLITFNVEIHSDETIETVKLNYGTNANTCQDGGSRQVLEFEPGTTLELSWDWELKRSGALPVGAEVWWQWEITSTSGSTLLTEKSYMVVADDRHAWQVVEADGVIVQWYLGDRDFGVELLEIATAGLDRLESEIGIRPPEDLRLVIYASSEDLQEALIHTYEWTGGIAMDDYNTTIIGISPSALSWASRVIPHELAHLVIGTLTFNCRGVSIPTWLHEGIAELAEAEPTIDEQDQLTAALADDELPSLKSLERGFSADPDQARLSYVQSKLFVDYLIRSYGAESLSSVLLTMQSGETIDSTLTSVYGADTAGLDSAWRQSLGYGYGEADTGDALPTPTIIPTLALWTPVIQPSTTATPSTTPTHTPTRTPVQPTGTPETIDDGIPASTPEQGEAGTRLTVEWGKIALGLGGFALVTVIIFILSKKGKNKS